MMLLLIGETAKNFKAAVKISGYLVCSKSVCKVGSRGIVTEIKFIIAEKISGYSGEHNPRFRANRMDISPPTGLDPRRHRRRVGNNFSIPIPVSGVHILKSTGTHG